MYHFSQVYGAVIVYTNDYGSERLAPKDYTSGHLTMRRDSVLVTLFADDHLPVRVLINALLEDDFLLKMKWRKNIFLHWYWVVAIVKLFRTTTLRISYKWCNIKRRNHVSFSRRTFLLSTVRLEWWTHESTNHKHWLHLCVSRQNRRSGSDWISFGVVRLNDRVPGGEVVASDWRRAAKNLRKFLITPYFV